MRYVAFYRNVNLGQGNSPTRLQLEAALAEAGAAEPRSFQTNGTVVLAAPDEQAATAIVERAGRALAAVCGLREPAYIAPLDHLVELVASAPFAGLQSPDVFDFSATFGPLGAFARLEPPLLSAKGDVQVLRVTPYVALSLSRKVGASVGSPTPFLEKLLAVPVTTRGWSTIERLVKKHGARAEALTQ